MTKPCKPQPFIIETLSKGRQKAVMADLDAVADEIGARGLIDLADEVRIATRMLRDHLGLPQPSARRRPQARA